MARQGKFARLPHALRESVNVRILNGESAGTILAWLNAEPDAIRVWDLHFEGAAATPQNLSEWRQGGWKEWLAEREKIERTKSLAAYAHEIAGAGGKLSKGLQAILAGHILEGFETLIHADQIGESEEDPGGKPDDPVKRIATLGGVVVAMRNADTAEDRLELDKEKVARKKEDQRLAREKFERQTVEMFLKFAQTKEAQQILNSDAKQSVKMQDLRKLMFG
jgi:hypothetical protein